MAALPAGEFLLPLFPLPNLVFFPKTRLPLHVFEPRYRQMITDALATDRRFGIVLLQPGWEHDYFGRPGLHECGTLATIEQALPMDDGKYNILVRGDVRFRIVHEEPQGVYRRATVIAQPEFSRKTEETLEQRARLANLSQRYLQYLPDRSEVPEIVTAGLDSLTNALIMSLNLEPEAKQKLLEMDDLLQRAEQTGAELERRIESLRFLAPFQRSRDPNSN